MEDKGIAIDFAGAHIRDDSGVGAIDRAVLKFCENANQVAVIVLDAGIGIRDSQTAIFKCAHAKLPTH
ncbi:hypothetical protein [Planococcus maitriensis]|uniref:hypothetical protein n=1 Tax=Planococcus maitriensis TaxID=221799 RepID=UPI0011BE2771|nr:hypothetical protein [Planococcus maitriensis]